MGSKITKLKKAISDTIIDEWYCFKVCEGCESVVDVFEVMCPVCRAYRFDESKERVISQADVLSNKYYDFITGKDLE